jgi:hypothetical protein
MLGNNGKEAIRAAKAIIRELRSGAESRPGSRMT